MRNFIQPGDILPLTAPGGGVVSGTPYQIGQLVVIAGKSAAATETFPGQTVGVFDVPKAASQAWAEGEPVYFDGSVFTTVATGNVLAGNAAAIVAGGAGDTTGRVRLSNSGGPDSA